MQNVVQSVHVVKSQPRKQFLTFIQKCWNSLPSFIHKEDPYKCNFLNLDLPKNWIFHPSPSGLIKYVAMYIANYLNGVDTMSDRDEQLKVLEKFHHFKFEAIAVMFSEQFSNKRAYIYKVRVRRHVLLKSNVMQCNGSVHGKYIVHQIVYCTCNSFNCMYMLGSGDDNVIKDEINSKYFYYDESSLIIIIL